MSRATEPLDLDAIHEAVCLIADDCDHATARDASGFSGFDADFGHSLAEQSTLTERQDVAAKRMLRKYWRQIPEDLWEHIYPGEPRGPSRHVQRN